MGLVVLKNGGWDRGRAPDDWDEYIEHERSDELRRLRSGPALGEQPFPMDMDFTVHCRGDAPTVLARAKEALGVVLEQDPEDWPPDEHWRTLLPGWFLERCQSGAAELPDAWPYRSWVFAFLPLQRSWWWFDGVVESHDLIQVIVEVDGWPFGSGNMDWLLRAAGAAEVVGNF